MLPRSRHRGARTGPKKGGAFLGAGSYPRKVPSPIAGMVTPQSAEALVMRSSTWPRGLRSKFVSWLPYALLRAAPNGP